MGRKLLPKLFLIIAVLLIAVRVALPWMIQRYVNGVLDRNPDYDGRIGDVDVHLWRGAYSIDDVEIVKTTGEVPVPFFAAEITDLSIEWRQLWNGALVGEVRFRKPVLNFVAGPSKAASQTGREGQWVDTLRALFPLRVNRLEVSGGEINYHDFHSAPQVAVKVDQVEGEARNLTNSEKISETLVATAELKGRAEEHAPLSVNLSFDPYRERPVFALKASLEQLELPRLNDVLRAYASIDAEDGEISIFTELNATEKSFEGYVKPIAKNVAVVSLEQDSDRPLLLVWESAVALVTEIFSNQRRDQFATVVPISGTFENPEIGVIDTLLEVLKNAFIEGLKPGLELDDTESE